MWLSGLRAESADRSPWGDFWFEPVSLRTLSGMRVSNDSAMRLTAVYRSVRLLSETFASLPFVLYRAKAGGGKELVTDHWLYRLFAKRPNRWQNPFEWREMVQGHVVHRGNAYNRIFTNGRGEIEELVPLHPDRVKLEVIDAEGNYRFRITNRRGAEEILPRGAIWHLRGLSSDGLLGLNPIELSREAVGLGISAQEYGARFFANDGRPVGGVIEIPASFKNEEDKKSFLESWQNARTGQNRFKTAILQQGMKYTDIPLNNRDSQFIEARQMSVADIARIYGIPPHMIGDLSKSTNNNIEQQSLEFVTYTMTPWSERWESSIESDLMLDDDALEVEFDFANLLRGDSKSRSTYYHNGIGDGWLTRNEARIAENRDPLPGLDEPLRPLNMVPESEVPDDEPDDETPPPDDNETTPPDDEEKPRKPPAKGRAKRASSRLEQLAAAAAQRIARKETIEARLAMAKEQPKAALTEFYSKHASFIAQALEVGALAATDYCTARLAFAIAAAESKDVEEATFTATAVVSLMKLALKGSR